jgi:hypothetical protein
VYTDAQFVLTKKKKNAQFVTVVSHSQTVGIVLHT